MSAAHAATREAGIGTLTGRLAREIELKLLLDPADAAAAPALPFLAGLAGTGRSYRTFFYDTPDRALDRAGLSLRVRRSGRRWIQTVKRRGADPAGLFVREEWEGAVAGPAPDPAALDIPPLRRWLAGVDLAALAPYARSRIRRTIWRLTHADSRIELVLDRGEIVAGARRAAVLEIELELIEGRTDALLSLAREIGGALPVRIAVMSKSERGLALADGTLDAPARAEAVRLARGVGQAEAFRAIVRECLRQYRRNEDALRATRDAEALHQLRVALRRLRAALSLFRPTVRGRDYQALREGLRWLGGRLGPARDLDVLLALAKDNAAVLGALRPLREAAHDRVAATLASRRARRLILGLALWIEGADWQRRGHAGRDVAPLAADRMERRWRRIVRHGHRLAALDATARHRLRIEIKKLRYAAEFMAPLHKAPARTLFVAALKMLQDGLGELNDAATAEDLARRVPVALRPAIMELHAARDRDGALAEAVRAMRRAEVAGGYWRDADPS